MDTKELHVYYLPRHSEPRHAITNIVFAIFVYVIKIINFNDFEMTSAGRQTFVCSFYLKANDFSAL